ncbi:MAG: porin [Noviherbaspirillum sp.]
MNKTVLALAAFATVAGAAQAQSSVLIYGIVDTGVTYNSRIAIATPGVPGAGTSGSRVSLDSGNLQGSRLGFRGTEDLGGGLKANFQLESGINVDTGTFGQGGLAFGRTAAVGLSGGFGSLSFGRQYDYPNDLITYTSNIDIGNLAQNLHGGRDLDRSSIQRVNNSIRYDTPKVGGLVGTFTYGLGEQAGDSSAGQSYSVASNYTAGAFAMGLGYHQSRLGTTPSETNPGFAGAGRPGDTALKTFLLGARYKFGAVNVFGSLSQVKQPLAVAGTIVPLATFLPTGNQFTLGGSNNHKSNMADLGIGYQLNPALKLTASAQHARAKFVGGAKGSLTQLNLAADYALSKRTDVFAIYANVRASDMYNTGATAELVGGDNTQNVVRFGVRHKF